MNSNDPEKRREYQRQWKKNHPGFWKSSPSSSPAARHNRYVRWVVQDVRKVLYQRAKSRAKKAGVEFSIELADIIVPDVCPIFKIPLSTSEKQRSNSSPSLDRIDSSKGYIKGNVWVISWRANHLKSNSSLEELEILVREWRNSLSTIPTTMLNTERNHKQNALQSEHDIRIDETNDTTMF